ncbi:MAG: hypothetical protein R3E01_30770 [Pirellulaceae bacterium]|nr:hypothetical protein [Planctomycetales bacterium]
MPYVLGTDEAGYGPNLGPLTIAGTLWYLPDDVAVELLPERLSDVVRRDGRNLGDGQIAIADSKLLYASGRGLQLLERAVWATLGAVGRTADSWRDIWQQLAQTSTWQIDDSPCYREYDERLPVDLVARSIELATANFLRVLADRGIRILDAQVAAVFPSQFNASVERWGNKSTLLSITTLELIRNMLASTGDGSALVLCDKHGGRNNYVPLLHEVFEDGFVQVCEEGRACSSYRLGPSNRRMEIRFQAKGESHLPAALSSILAKYLRELAMRAFNAFWRVHQPGLRPTAGYPVDAKRFFSETAIARQKLGIADHTIWRCR